MPTLWAYDAERGVWEWERIFTANTLHEPTPAFQLLQFPLAGKYDTALLSSLENPVFVNGEPVIAGLRILSHRDEVLCAGQRFAFSFESQPQIVCFEAAANRKQQRCPVCRSALQNGQAVVRCPGCGRAHHQIDGADKESSKHCWTFYDACKFCGHSTALIDEPRWRPAEEELDG